MVENLTAILGATNNISKELNDISEGFIDVAFSASTVAAPSEVAAESIEEVGDEAGRSTRKLSTLTASIASTAAAMGALSGRDIDIDTDFDKNKIDEDSFLSLSGDTLSSIREATEDATADLHVNQTGNTYIPSGTRRATVKVDVDDIAWEAFKMDVHRFSEKDVNIDVDTKKGISQLDSFNNKLNNTLSRRTKSRSKVEAVAQAVGVESTLRTLGQLDDVDFDQYSAKKVSVQTVSDATTGDFVSSDYDTSNKDVLTRSLRDSSTVDVDVDVDDAQLDVLMGKLKLVTAKKHYVKIGSKGGLQALAGNATSLGNETNRSKKNLSGIAERIDDMGSFNLDLGPVNLRMQSLLTSVPILIGLAGSLAAAIGAISIAALGFAGVFSFLAAGGVLAMAQGMVGTSDDIKTKWDAIRKIVKNFTNALANAIQPLQNAGNIDFVLSLMNGLLDTVSLLARFSQRVREEFMGAADAMGAGFWNNQPQLFAAMEQAFVELLPMLTDLFVWTMQKLPEAFDWFRKEGKTLLPVMGNLSQVLLHLVVQFTELGTTILRLINPYLSTAIGLVASLTSLFNKLPNPIKEGIIMFLAFGAAISVLKTLATLVFLAGSSLWGMIGATIGAVSAISGFLSILVGQGLITALLSATTGLAGLTKGFLVLRAAMAVASVHGMGRALIFLSTAALNATKSVAVLGTVMSVLRNATVVASFMGAKEAIKYIGLAAWGAIPGVGGLTTASSGLAASLWAVLAPLTLIGIILGAAIGLTYMIARFVNFEVIVWDVVAAVDALLDGILTLAQILAYVFGGQAIGGLFGIDVIGGIEDMKGGFSAGERPDQWTDRGADLGFGNMLTGKNDSPVGKPSARRAYGRPTVNQNFYGDVGPSSIEQRTQQAVQTALADEVRKNTPLTE